MSGFHSSFHTHTDTQTHTQMRFISFLPSAETKKEGETLGIDRGQLFSPEYQVGANFKVYHNFDGTLNQYEIFKILITQIFRRG